MPDDLLSKALPLRGLADAVNVTDGASARAHLSAPIAAAMLAREGIEPILQFACRDRNRIALQGELMGAAACGVRNLLLLTGDDPKAGDQPETKPVFDLDSTTSTAMARDLRDKGELPSGRKVAGRAHFFLGAADAADRPAARLAARQARGQDRSRRRVRADPVLHGCGARAALRGAPRRARRDPRPLPADRHRTAALGQVGALDGGAPLRHHHPGGLIERLERAADPAAEGARIAIELIEELAHVPGVAGVHIMAPANEAAVPEVIAEARKRLPKR